MLRVSGKEHHQHCVGVRIVAGRPCPYRHVDEFDRDQSWLPLDMRCMALHNSNRMLEYLMLHLVDPNVNPNIL